MFHTLQKKVQQNFQSLGIPQDGSNKFLDDIFGKCEGGIKMEGLVDASSIEDFDAKLNALEEHWNICESPMPVLVVCRTAPTVLQV